MYSLGRELKEYVKSEHVEEFSVSETVNVVKATRNWVKITSLEGAILTSQEFGL